MNSRTFHSPQPGEDDLEAALFARLEEAGGPPPEWSKPARELGITPIFASSMLRRPLQQVHAVYVWGFPPSVPPIGRRDPWDCLYARMADVWAVFAPTTDQVANLATCSEPPAMQRTRAKAAALRLKLGRGS